MQYFEISYYRSYHWVDKKYVKTELGVTDAIQKSRLKKTITNIEEVTEQRYLEIKEKQKRLKQEKENFIQY